MLVLAEPSARQRLACDGETGQALMARQSFRRFGEGHAYDRFDRGDRRGTNGRRVRHDQGDQPTVALENGDFLDEGAEAVTFLQFLGKDVLAAAEDDQLLQPALDINVSVASGRPKSPVRNQPSSVNAARLASGLSR